jgi:hypothetical protein
MEKVSGIVSSFYKEKSKSEFKGFVAERTQSSVEDEWVGSFSTTIVDHFSLFFFSVCELAIEILSAFKLNMTRGISSKT